MNLNAAISWNTITFNIIRLQSKHVYCCGEIMALVTAVVSFWSAWNIVVTLWWLGVHQHRLPVEISILHNMWEPPIQCNMYLEVPLKLFFPLYFICLIRICDYRTILFLLHYFYSSYCCPVNSLLRSAGVWTSIIALIALLFRPHLSFIILSIVNKCSVAVIKGTNW